MLTKKSLFGQLIYVRYFILFLGLLITGYLIYVNNLSDSILSCGNAGDCNKVQNSSYGFLLGIPVTFLGMVYFCFLTCLYTNYFLRKKFATSNFIELIGFSTSLSAFIFSMYLTYIELFVINEVCIWCISIAILSTLIFIINLYTLIFVKKYV
jgi:uncharacterized membrane protein